MLTETDVPETTPPTVPTRMVHRVALGAFVTVVGIVAGLALGSPARPGGTDADPVLDAAIAVAGVDPATAVLPLSTTRTTVDGAPVDQTPWNATDGLVVHPIRETPIHETPDGKPLARLPRTMLGDAGDTWLPVIDQQPGWVRVLLPSKPNGSTGWIRAADVEDARTPFVINVRLGQKKVQLLKDGRVTDTWTVGIGKPSAPTPVGRTFLLGAFTDPNQQFSPVILPLGTHSATLDTFGGGPGTVAIHTWPTADVFGTGSSDGCIRVPAAALTKLTAVPLGTLVMITDD
ncbi:L,D-transpeptidase family protein [Pseudonocardia sp. CA-107938]|uniref:L,D-transpeptidase family protein n=1 Tax=Pseudonocardia sp. CA-107938 TaxID=3240021 RepID=UPI003D902C70